MDFTLYFKQYEDLVNAIESACGKVKTQHAECVACQLGCADCCHALFDITLVEALYIKQKFDETFTGKMRHDIITAANETDRQIYKIKKNATEAEKIGVDGSKIINRISKEKIRCPLLSQDNSCLLYQYRPIACRVYGIPTSAAGVGYTCGLSRFQKGVQYPTLNMDNVYKKLYSISNLLVKDIKSKYKQMGDVLVPVSMCLLTDYNDEYLGIDNTPLEIIR
jgi:Fe-S-cluster containining protein